MQVFAPAGLRRRDQDALDDRPEQRAGRAGSGFAADLLDAFNGHGTKGLRPVLDRTFPLKELPAAHEYMLTNQQLGKVVLVR